MPKKVFDWEKLVNIGDSFVILVTVLSFKMLPQIEKIRAGIAV
ncbi:MAG: hypothetical protein ACTSRU_20705 [Candidatus Hodarchaeales archaeon]